MATRVIRGRRPRGEPRRRSSRSVCRRRGGLHSHRTIKCHFGFFSSSIASCHSLLIEDSPKFVSTRGSFSSADQKDRLGRDPNESDRHAAQEQVPEATPAVRANHDKISGPAGGFLLDRVVDAITGFADRK